MRSDSSDNKIFSRSDERFFFFSVAFCPGFYPSGNNAAAIQSGRPSYRAGLKAGQRAGAGNAPLASGGPGHGRTGGAHGSSVAALQSLLGSPQGRPPVAFNVLGVVATKSTPDGVDLKLSNYSTACGSIALANNASWPSQLGLKRRLSLLSHSTFAQAAGLCNRFPDQKVQPESSGPDGAMLCVVKSVPSCRSVLPDALLRSGLALLSYRTANEVTGISHLLASI